MPPIISDSIAWVVVVLSLVVLGFVWLIFITRGRRETKVQFSGLGVAFTIESADRKVDASERPTVIVE